MSSATERKLIVAVLCSYQPHESKRGLTSSGVQAITMLGQRDILLFPWTRDRGIIVVAGALDGSARVKESLNRIQAAALVLWSDPG